MYREYGVDPSAFVEWCHDGVFLDSFGSGEGRFISAYPSHWKKMVVSALGATPHGVSSTQVQVALEELIKECAFVEGRVGSFSDRQSWIENASDAHSAIEFSAILANANPKRENFVLTRSELGRKCPQWRVNKNLIVKRMAKHLGAVAEKLLHVSREVVLHDPYFLFEDSPKNDLRWKNPIFEIVRLATSSQSLLPKSKLEYHTRANGSVDLTEFKKRLSALKIHSALTGSQKLVIVRWVEANNKEKFHPRYVLTEVGGLRYDYGLDEGGSSQTTDVTFVDAIIVAQRLEDFNWRKWRDTYQGGFIFQDAVVVTNSDYIASRDIKELKKTMGVA